MRYQGPKLILYSETPSPTGLTEDLSPSASLSNAAVTFTATFGSRRSNQRLKRFWPPWMYSRTSIIFGNHNTNVMIGQAVAWGRFGTGLAYRPVLSYSIVCRKARRTERCFGSVRGKAHTKKKLAPASPASLKKIIRRIAGHVL